MADSSIRDRDERCTQNLVVKPERKIHILKLGRDRGDNIRMKYKSTA